MGLMRVRSAIGTPEFGKYLQLAGAYAQPCNQYRQFMTANWCQTCHHYEHEHATPCPNHGGAYDCTPFCELCEGNQETPNNRKGRK